MGTIWPLAVCTAVAVGAALAFGTGAWKVLIGALVFLACLGAVGATDT